MPGQMFTTTRKPYLRILTSVGSNWVETVTKDTPNAKLRIHEQDDGTKTEKWELHWMNWKGILKSIQIHENKFGDTCSIELDDVILSLNVNSRFFVDFAQKIHSADLSKEILFHPFDFTDDTGKRRQGISLQQNDGKLANAFYDSETKKNIKGFPEVDNTKLLEIEKQLDSNGKPLTDKKKKDRKKLYWTAYFQEVTEFLIDELGKLKIPTPAVNNQIEAAKEIFGGEEVDLDSLPF